METYYNDNYSDVLYDTAQKPKYKSENTRKFILTELEKLEGKNATQQKVTVDFVEYFRDAFYSLFSVVVFAFMLVKYLFKDAKEI